jgi:hypothetical protein
LPRIARNDGLMVVAFTMKRDGLLMMGH